jgi:hypothetical protein
LDLELDVEQGLDRGVCEAPLNPAGLVEGFDYAVEALASQPGESDAGEEREGCPGSAYSLAFRGGEKTFAEDAGALLFCFEKDVTTRIQLARSDLLFVHAAVLGHEGRAILLAGDPGAGKSTLAFALLERGLRYLSDELAPIALATLAVHPYPRALWLKRAPPEPHALPSAAFESTRGIHVPCRSLGATPAEAPLPLAALFLLEPGVASRPRPALRRIGAAEGTARLFAHVLNPRGHASDGLDAVGAVASGAPCYLLEPAGLEATVSLVLGALGESRGE